MFRYLFSSQCFYQRMISLPFQGHRRVCDLCHAVFQLPCEIVIDYDCLKKCFKPDWGLEQEYLAPTWWEWVNVSFIGMQFKYNFVYKVQKISPRFQNITESGISQYPSDRIACRIWIYFCYCFDHFETFNDIRGRRIFLSSFHTHWCRWKWNIRLLRVTGLSSSVMLQCCTQSSRSWCHSLLVFVKHCLPN